MLPLPHRYDLQYKLSNNFGVWAPIDRHVREGEFITDTESVAVDLRPRTTYRYRVRAKNRFGFGPFSPFSITYETLDDGGIRLLAPQCTSVWKRGQRIKVSFRSTKTVRGLVQICLYKGKVRVAEIFKGTYPLTCVYNDDFGMYDGEYFWHVPGHAIVGNTYQVKISSATYGNVFSLSEPFSIVTVLPPDKGTLVSGQYCMKRPAAALVQRESDEARSERQEHELKVAQEAQAAMFEEVLKELVKEVHRRAAARALKEREAMLVERDAEMRAKQQADRRRKLLKKA